MAPFGALRHVR